LAKNPQTSAQKWASNLGAATTAIQNGVAAVTVSPTSKAAQAVDRMVAGVQRAAASGKIANALNAVSLQSWQQSMTQKGIPRIATGAQAALPKFQAFLTQLIPFQQAGLAQLPPRGDINQNIQRMTAWAQYMSTFKKQ
jgi:hypothetical protein